MDDLLETQAATPLGRENIDEVMSGEQGPLNSQILKDHNYRDFAVIGNISESREGYRVYSLVARHNRMKRDPLRSILKREQEEVMAIQSDESSDSEGGDGETGDGRTVFSDETQIKGTEGRAKLGDIRVRYT